MKKCPYCAEEIQDEAIVCKHCGRDQPGYEDKIAELESVKAAATKLPQVAEEPPKEQEKTNRVEADSKGLMYALMVILGLFILLFLPRISGCVSGENSGSSTSGTIACTDYKDDDQPIAWTKGSGRIDVYGGISQPNKDDVKGSVDPNAAIRVERYCGTWYRVQGVDWWGWIRSTNINWSGD